MFSVKAAVAAFAAATLLGSAAHASGVLDQDAGPFGGGFGEFLHWQQQVTAGVSGELAGIELYGDGTSLDVGVTPGQAFQTGPFAFSTHTTLTSAGVFIDTSAAHIMLNAGDQFVIDFSNGANGNLAGAATQYAGGDVWLAFGSFSFDYNASGAPGSLAFKTFMTAASSGAPEPGTWGLMIVGFGLAGLGLRRRRVASAA